jgi:AcrR family transcriptional regulator
VPVNLPPDGRRARWADHRAGRRAELVEAAVVAIGRHGPALGMDDIAAEAGVSKPVIYRYFTDKADLYLAVGQHVATGLLQQITAQLSEGRMPRESLTAAIDAYLELIENAPDVYRFVVSRPFLDRPTDAASNLVHDYESLIAEAVARTVGEQLRAAGLDSGGAEPWAYGLVGAVRAAGEWWLERHSMTRAALTAYLVQLLWSGVEDLYEQSLSRG